MKVNSGIMETIKVSVKRLSKNGSRVQTFVSCAIFLDILNCSSGEVPSPSPSALAIGASVGLVLGAVVLGVALLLLLGVVFGVGLCDAALYVKGVLLVAFI